MRAEDKIFVDASQPAMLRYTGACVSFESLRLAIAGWRKLPPELKECAAIFAADGSIYDPCHIPALYDRREGSSRS